MRLLLVLAILPLLYVLLLILSPFVAAFGHLMFYLSNITYEYGVWAKYLFEFAILATVVFGFKINKLWFLGTIALLGWAYYQTM